MSLLSKGDKTPKKAVAPAPASKVYEVKYPKPKILLLDLDENSEDAIRKLGLKVTSGSLGKPYKVPRSDQFQPVIIKASFPNHKEQEIVVIDLWYGKSDDGPQAEKHKPDGSVDLWSDCTTGRIDPRPRAMFTVKDDFDRILSNGGVFVIFAEDLDVREMHFGAAPYRDLKIEKTIKVDNWSFLSCLSELSSTDDHGEEMSCALKGGALPDLVSKHLDGGNFSCTFDPYSYAESNWVVLARNKFGAGVAAARKREGEGIVLVLPQVANKPKFLEDLFSEILPILSPKLFPHIEKGLWTHLPEYELEGIIALDLEKKEVEQKAANAIATINENIVNERKVNGWIHDLLTATGDELVKAVKAALSSLGFDDVVDVDEERDADGESRREDLQIKDLSPVLVVDIKGLGGFPADSDASQSHKHAVLRMREWKRFDVQPLTIINHQRYLAPLDRDNLMPFRKEIVDHANEMSIGLMTTWDLYRLVRSAMKWGWPPSSTRPVLYRLGRIDPAPHHYTYIGTIAHVWTGALSINVEAVGLRIGDRIAYELDVAFEEEDVESLQVDKQPVTVAEIGTKAGVASKFHRPAVKDEMRVFLVQKQAPEGVAAEREQRGKRNE